LLIIIKWCDELLAAGPALGYYPNAKKCWLVVKPEKLKEANDVFSGTGINITTEGRKHLGAALGQRSYLEEYVGSKVKEWISEVTLLADFERAESEYSASVKMSAPLVDKIIAQSHETPDMQMCES